MKNSFDGICCSYDADIPTSPTGFTWRQLAEHRERNYREVLRIKGNQNPTFEQLLVWDGYPEPFYKYKRMLTKGIKSNHFIAFDIETANSRRDSICAIGIVEVKDSEIIDEQHWYIKPEPFEIDLRNKRIHGIGELMLANCKSFGEVWPEIEPFFSVGHAVAHNIGFDKSSILSALEGIGKNLDNVQFACTLKLSKLAYDLESYKLPDVCKYVGYDFGKHHDALDDAKGCAAIYIDLLDNPDEVNEGEVKDSVKKIQYKKRNNINLTDLRANTVHLNQKLAGFVMVFTGELSTLSREEAWNKVQSFGGEIRQSISSKTTHLVLGHNDSTSNKEAEALRLGISILSENEFLELI